MRVCVLLIAALATGCSKPGPSWTDAERAQIAALSLSRLGPPPPDPGNAVAELPEAVALGEKLFFDMALSGNGKVACASCHEPARAFTDGRALARGIREAQRNAPSLVGAAWSRWQFWDGRADSLWAQATGPLLDAAEMGASPAHVAEVVVARYGSGFETLFGKPPKDPMRAVVNAGKVLDAYLRTLRPARARFDDFADALAAGAPGEGALSRIEQRGLKVFLGTGQCLRCHHGPLLTNHGFHNTGLSPLRRPADRGRATGLPQVLASSLNCAGAFSDAARRDCPHLQYARVGGAELIGAFKAPSLRNVAATAPYMHDGRFATLGEVLDHYNRAPGIGLENGHTELFPLGLDAAELADLEALLRALGPAAGT